MFAVAGYVLGCLLLSFVLTVVVSLLKPLKQRDDFISWRLTAVFFALSLAIPYAYIEVMTRMHLDEVSPTIEQAINEVGVTDATLLYEKVFTYGEGKAKAIAVIDEPSDWGTRERAVMEFALTKDEDGWIAEEATFLNSSKRNKETLLMPPFW